MPASVRIRYPYLPTARISMGVFAIVAVTVCLGCGGNVDPDTYTPEGDAARQALELSLTTWQAGKKSTDVGALAEQGAAVRIVDSEWEAGKKLQSFEIKGDAAAPTTGSADSVARAFSVRLVFAGSSTPQDVIYHVVGKDPLLVFRDKDFVQTQGM